MMQNRWRIWTVALWAAVVACSIGSSARAETNGRLAVASRQQVRAALAAAMADGTLSVTEADRIYRCAEKLLPPAELPGLQRTLGRLAARQEPSLPHAPRQPAEGEQGAAEEPGETAQAGFIAPGGEKLAETASYDQLAAEDQPADLDQPAAGDQPPTPVDQPAAEDDQESPFHEEILLEGEPLMDHPTVTFEDSFGMLSGFWSVFFDQQRNVSLYTTVDAFKGPLDLDNQNGNFGVNFAINGGVPLAKRFEIGIQGGTSAVLSDFHGTQFTGAESRAQNFTTVGLFQHIPFLSRDLKWGFAYDWLYDDYYTTFKMGQWRVKLGCELDPCNEIGIWVCIPDHGDSVWLSHSRIINDEVVALPPTFERFKPVSQINVYYRRCWWRGASTTAWLGTIEEPGELVFGTDARIPISRRLAFVGSFNYVLPSASGEAGQDEEMWNVSMGIELTPRWGTNHCHNVGRYAPLFPLANNGTFAIRRF